MEQSQLVELIRTLSPEEMEHVREFSTLHFFNSGSLRNPAITLLNICIDHPWHIEGQKLEKETLYPKLFPGQVWIDGRIEKTMVDAHKVVRCFLLTQKYFEADNEFAQLLDFSEIMRQRELNNRYQQVMSKLQKMLDSYPFDNKLKLKRQYELEFYKCDEASVRNQGKGDLNILNTLQALELDYQLKQLELVNQLLLQQKITVVEVPERLSTQLEKISVPDTYLEAHPVLQINYAIYQLLRKEPLMTEDAQYLFGLLQRHEGKFDKRSLQEFYSYLRNVCILALNVDFERIEIDALLKEIYRDNLKRGYIHYEGKINRSKFWAISSNATRTKDFEWAWEFLETYKDEIRDDNETKDIYRINLANYLFAIGRFEESLENIPPHFPYVDYMLISKRLELMALYELRSDLLSYKMDAFKMFLSRTGKSLLSKSQKDNNSDFVNVLLQIYRSTSGDSKRSETIVKRLSEKKHINNWAWLMAKAVALKKR